MDGDECNRARLAKKRARNRARRQVRLLLSATFIVTDGMPVKQAPLWNEDRYLVVKDTYLRAAPRWMATSATGHGSQESARAIVPRVRCVLQCSLSFISTSTYYKGRKFSSIPAVKRCTSEDNVEMDEDERNRAPPARKRARGCVWCVLFFHVLLCVRWC